METFEQLIPDEAEAPPAEPTPDPMASLSSRLDEMSQRINEAYQMNKGYAQPAPQPQVQYVPYPMYQQPEAEVSEADILADLPGALAQVREETAREVEERLRAELGQHLGRVYEKEYERDVRDLSQQPYWDYVKEDMKAHFEKNPAEKYQPGRLQEVYHSLLGSKISEIREAEAKEKESNEPARVRSVDHSIKVGPSVTPSNFTQKEEVTLSDKEEAARQRANKIYGTNISKAEWAADQEGKLFPTDFDEDMY